MKPRKNLKSVLLALFVLSSLPSCRSVRVSNTEWCGDMGRLGASCFHTLTDHEREISPSDWESYRFGMICATAEDFAEIKKSLLKLCASTRKCKYDTRIKIQNFGIKVQRNHAKTKKQAR